LWQNIQCQALFIVSQREQAFLQDVALQILQRMPFSIKNGAKQQMQRLSSISVSSIFLIEFFLKFLFI
jgi:hypothetical protein